MNAITKRLKEALDGYANHTELSAGIEEAIDIIEGIKCLVLEEITEEEAKDGGDVIGLSHGTLHQCYFNSRTLPGCAPGGGRFLEVDARKPYQVDTVILSKRAPEDPGDRVYPVKFYRLPTEE